MMLRSIFRYDCGSCLLRLSLFSFNIYLLISLVGRGACLNVMSLLLLLFFLEKKVSLLLLSISLNFMAVEDFKSK